MINLEFQKVYTPESRTAPQLTTAYANTFISSKFSAHSFIPSLEVGHFGNGSMVQDGTF